MTLAIGVVKLASSFAMTPLMDRMGRRPLMISGQIGCMICHGALIMCDQFHKRGAIHRIGINIWTVGGILCLLMATTTFVGGVTSTIMAEIFDQRSRAAGQQIEIHSEISYRRYKHTK